MNETENIECEVIGKMLTKKENRVENDTTKISGIYKITNKINGRYYFGSSKDISYRWKIHLRKLNKGVHHSPFLQRDFNKCGQSNFEFSIIEGVDELNLLKVEQTYLDISKLDKNNSYNVSFTAGGGKCEPHVLDKIKRCWTDEKRQAHRILRTGNKNFFYGKVHTEETKNIISNLHKGKKHTIEHVNKRITRGLENGEADKTIYSFVNDITNEKFIGYRFDFKKYLESLNKPYPKSMIYNISKLKQKSKTGWRVEF